MQGSAKGRVFPGRVDPARVSGFRAGFRVENSKIRVSGRVPGCSPGSGTRRKLGNKLCFLTLGGLNEKEHRDFYYRGGDYNTGRLLEISGPGRPARCRALTLTIIQMLENSDLNDQHVLIEMTVLLYIWI